LDSSFGGDLPTTKGRIKLVGGSTMESLRGLVCKVSIYELLCCCTSIFIATTFFILSRLHPASHTYRQPKAKVDPIIQFSFQTWRHHFDHKQRVICVLWLLAVDMDGWMHDDDC
jgi:hypothetical protein